MLFTEDDFYDYDALSVDDKSIVDMLYEMEEINILQQELDSLHNTDNDVFKNLPDKEKEFIDRIAEAYQKTSAGAAYVKLRNEDRKRYGALSIEDKTKTDRIVASLIWQAMNPPEKPVEIMIVDNLNIVEIADSSDIILEDDQQYYERLVSVLLAAEIYDLDAKYTLPDYELSENLTLDDRSLADMIFKSRAFELIP